MEYSKRRETGKRSVGPGRHGRGVTLGRRERRRLLQLLVCVALFLTAFLGRGQEKLSRLREELTDAVFGSMNVRAVFTDLGWALTTDQPAAEVADTIWNGLFAPEEAVLVMKGLRAGPLLEGRMEALDRGELFVPPGTQRRKEAAADPLEASGARPKPEEPEVIHMDYIGPALPDNATMDRYALGLEKTMTPVLGTLASGFGWREHPIDGGQKFHQGVDLAVPTGTAVAAFADGQVEFVGESQVYGKYLQLRHAGGITSFYCHCSRLLVQEGEHVTVGQTVAEVGATGRVTGPHLHFELRRDGVLLQPLYYIETRA